VRIVSRTAGGDGRWGLWGVYSEVGTDVVHDVEEFEFLGRFGQSVQYVAPLLVKVVDEVFRVLLIAGLLGDPLLARRELAFPHRFALLFLIEKTKLALLCVLL